MQSAWKSANASVQGARPWTLVGVTAASTALLLTVTGPTYRAIRRHGLLGALQLVALKIAKNAPGAAGVVAKENAKLVESMREELLGAVDQGERRLALPKTGVSEEELFRIMGEWKEVEDGIWKKGGVSGGIYHGGDELKAVLNRVYAMFSITNPLHPEVFPYVRKMEAEVVRMSCTLFNGGPETCGTMTSGGSESILSAMKAYRDLAVKEHGIEVPEIVAPHTAHAAFDKAASYFGMKLVKVQADPVTCAADVRAMERAITRNTIVIVGSAPPYPQGVIDPIEELAEVARRRKVCLHVDACLGGFLLPFARAAGYDVPPFDFEVEGVTSMSADPHKFGFAPKGCSVVLYSSAELRKHQFFTATDFSGGVYASPGIQGSRPGGLIAGCWAAMVHIGHDGYVEIAGQIMATAKKIEAGVRAMPGVHVLGRPNASVVAFGMGDDETDNTSLDIFKVNQAMTARGWCLNPLQFPVSAHICVTRMHVGRGDRFLSDLRESLDEVREHPKRYAEGSAAIYGLAATLPDRSMVEDIAKSYLNCLFEV